MGVALAAAEVTLPNAELSEATAPELDAEALLSAEERDSRILEADPVMVEDKLEVEVPDRVVNAFPEEVVVADDPVAMVVLV